jgi:hypothetical protein
MPHHPDLTDHIAKLRRQLSNDKASDKQIESQVKEIGRRLRKKFPNASGSLLKAIINLEANGPQPSRANLLTILNTANFKNALRRTVDATYHSAVKTNDIYCALLNDFIPSVRVTNRNRLIIENSFVALANGSKQPAIQSWSRPASKSAEYNRHLRNSGNRKKSKFLLPTDAVEELELVLFNRGVGYLKSVSKMFFYGQFSGLVGRLSDGKTPVTYVALQCDRCPRLVGRGTRLEIHSYPISRSEIASDLAAVSGTSDFLQRLDQQILDLPQV